MTTIKGVWVFNEAPDLTGYLPLDPVLFNFTSNGQAFLGMYSNYGPFEYISEITDYEIDGMISTKYNTVVPNYGSSWVDDAYRTVDFGDTAQEVPEDFYAWFTANAVYQDVDPEPGPSPIVGTLKEEALKLRQNLDKIYEAGRIAGGGVGYTQEELDQAVADATEQGKQAERNTFWDAFLDRDGNYKSVFNNDLWTDEVYNPNKPIIITASNADMLFNNACITNTKVPIEIRVASANMMFAYCYYLKTIPYLGFFGVTNTGSFFVGCSALENVTFDGEITTGISFANCSKLTNASVQSYIDHLADMTGQTAVKIVFHSATVANLTAEQLEQIANKNFYIG